MNNKTFINFSNHSSNLWGEKQTNSAKKYLLNEGEIIDITFPKISPKMGSNEIDKLVSEYSSKINLYEKPIVMIQGEFVFTYRMVCKLKEMGIVVVCACTERKAMEELNDDGTVSKKSIFNFAGFREY